MEDIHPLKAYREAHDPQLSQAELADILGVTNTTVWRWEANKRKVDDELLLMVAEKTGIAAAELRPDLAALMQPAAEVTPDTIAPETEQAAS